MGTRLAYTAEHLSLAMIEYFIHIDPDDPPKNLVTVTAEVPDSVSRTLVSQELAQAGAAPSNAFFWLAFLVEVALVGAACVAAGPVVVVAVLSVVFVIVAVPFVRVVRA